MCNSTIVRCCPNCGANNMVKEQITLVAINGDIKQFSCYRCGNVWVDGGTQNVKQKMVDGSVK